MKVNDLEESELRVYAHLHKLLSKSEMMTYVCDYMTPGDQYENMFHSMGKSW